MVIKFYTMAVSLRPISLLLSSFVCCPTKTVLSPRLFFGYAQQVFNGDPHPGRRRIAERREVWFTSYILLRLLQGIAWNYPMAAWA